MFITELPPDGVLGPGQRPSLFKELVRFAPGKPRPQDKRQANTPGANYAAAQRHYTEKRMHAGDFGSYRPDVRAELAGFMPSAIATPVGSSLGTATAVARVQRPAPISAVTRGGRGGAENDGQQEHSVLTELKNTWDAIEYFAKSDLSGRSGGAY